MPLGIDLNETFTRHGLKFRLVSVREYRAILAKLAEATGKPDEEALSIYLDVLGKCVVGWELPAPFSLDALQDQLSPGTLVDLATSLPVTLADIEREKKASACTSPSSTGTSAEGAKASAPNVPATNAP